MEEEKTGQCKDVTDFAKKLKLCKKLVFSVWNFTCKNMYQKKKKKLVFSLGRMIFSLQCNEECGQGKKNNVARRAAKCGCSHWKCLVTHDNFLVARLGSPTLGGRQAGTGSVMLHANFS